MLLCPHSFIPTFLGGRIWKSNLGAGQGKLVGSFVMTHRSWPQPDPQATLNRIANNGFSVLNWHLIILSYAFLSQLSWCFLLSCWVLLGDQAEISFCMLQQQPARIPYVLEHAMSDKPFDMQCNVNVLCSSWIMFHDSWLTWDVWLDLYCIAKHM